MEPEPQVLRKKRGRWRAWLLWALLPAFLGVLACWIIPLRLAFGPGGNSYTFGYLPDEYAYSQRIDVPPAGATFNNPYNGIADNSVILQMFLEHLCATFVRVTHVSVIAFFWAWRFLFPLALLACCCFLAHAAVGRTWRPWRISLVCLLAAAAPSALYGLYHLLVDPFTTYHLSEAYLPIFFFLNRIPTNVEFLLGLALMALYVRFMDQPSPRRGVGLALMLALTVYLRPFAAVPWACAFAAGGAWLWFQGRLPWRVWLAAGLVFALAIVPYLFVWAWNSRSPAYVDQMTRLFLLPFDYMVHPHWKFFISLAGLLAACAWLVRAPQRATLLSCALSLAVLPFLCGLLKPAARELLSNDRFSCYHLAVLLGALMLITARYAARRPGWRGLAGVRRALGRVAAVGLLCAAGVAFWSWSFVLSPNGKFYPAFVQRDLRFHTAYEWVRTQTPPEALFLLDDGYDWTQAPRDQAGLNALSSEFMFYQADFFGTLARRRRVFSDFMAFHPIAQADLDALALLHWGTFGLPVDKARYIAAIKQYRPDYVFWRKTPPIFVPDGAVPVPRGEYGRLLQQISTPVYDDRYCHIRKIEYGGSAPAPGH